MVKVFDAISYEKGATIINMLMSYLGPEKTSQAMHLYVQRYCYKNVNATALWNTVQDVVGEQGSDITAAIEHWLAEAGHPMVEVPTPPFPALLSRSILTANAQLLLPCGAQQQMFKQLVGQPLFWTWRIQWGWF